MNTIALITKTARGHIDENYLQVEDAIDKAADQAIDLARRMPSLGLSRETAEAVQDRTSEARNAVREGLAS